MAIKIRRDGLFEIIHAPGANLDYGFDWSDYLGVGETIVTSTWTISPTLTLANQQILNGICSTYVNGGVEGKLYTLTNTIVTSLRTDSRTIILVCQAKGAC